MSNGEFTGGAECDEFRLSTLEQKPKVQIHELSYTELLSEAVGAAKGREEEQAEVGKR